VGKKQTKIYIIILYNDYVFVGFIAFFRACHIPHTQAAATFDMVLRASLEKSPAMASYELGSE